MEGGGPGAPGAPALSFGVDTNELTNVSICKTLQRLLSEVCRWRAKGVFCALHRVWQTRSGQGLGRSL